jgi:myo-inositol-1(or 4)-monophosphatase
MASVDPMADRLSRAEAAAREAGVLAMDHFGNLEAAQVARKGAQDYVSRADREVEALLRDRLMSAFPEDQFLGEELGGREGRGVWVVDPIDGTGNFVRGIPVFGISIAYWLEGQTEVGVVYDPCRDEMYSATRSRPATKNGATIHVREVRDLSDTVMALGFTTKEPKESFLRVMRELLEAGAEFRRFGAAVLCLAWTAEGRVDGFFHTSLNAWDALAGMLLIRQAGGITNLAFGKGELLTRPPTVAAAPGIAERIAAITGVPLETRA